MNTNEHTKQNIHRMRIGKVAQGILVVSATAGFVLVVAALPGLSMAMAPFLKKKRYNRPSHQSMKRSLRSLERNRLIKKQTLKNGEIKISLTAKGKWQAFLSGYHKEKSVKPEKWDGLWRVIIFDIPESKKDYRMELRKAFVSYGFILLQKSVWVYPYPCEDFVSVVKKHLGITHDVLYMTSNYIENDKFLRAEFKL